MEQFNVTGMSCAACSARVEKAVKKVPGVTRCSVSLLTNSMGVEGTASDAAIIRAVQDAGYGASPKRAGAAAAPGTGADLDALADHETPKLKRRLIASLGFLLVLMYFSMGHMMWGWPLPRWFDGNHNRDKGQDHGGRLKIEFVHICHNRRHITVSLRPAHGKHRIYAPAKRCGGSQRNQRIHIGSSACQRFKSAYEEFLIYNHNNSAKQKLHKSHCHMVACKPCRYRKIKHHMPH